MHRDALTVNGKTMGENTAEAPCWNAEVIRAARQPHPGACRHCRSAGQSGTRRRFDQTFGGDAKLAQTPRPGGRVQGYRGFQAAH